MFKCSFWMLVFTHQITDVSASIFNSLTLKIYIEILILKLAVVICSKNSRKINKFSGCVAYFYCICYFISLVVHSELTFEKG